MFPTVEEVSTSRGKSGLRALAQLNKLAKTLSWVEIATALSGGDSKFGYSRAERWASLCGTIEAPPDFFNGVSEEEIQEKLTILFEKNRVTFSALIFDTIVMMNNWNKFIKNAEEDMLKAPMHFTVDFNGTLEELAKTYADRSDVNNYDAKLWVMDFFLAFGGFQLKGATVQIQELIEQDPITIEEAQD
jgi:hypothetical protein